VIVVHYLNCSTGRGHRLVWRRHCSGKGKGASVRQPYLVKTVVREVEWRACLLDATITGHKAGRSSGGESGVLNTYSGN